MNASISNVSSTASPDLTPLQQAYWIGGRGDFDLHVYPHLYIEFDVEAIEPDRLSRAVESLIECHPLLRASFSPEGVFELAKETSPGISIHDLAALSNIQVEQSLDQTRDRLRRFEFPPGSTPRIHVEVTKAATFCRVHICLDLMLFDGSAVRLLLTDLSRFYRGLPSDSQPQSNVTFSTPPSKKGHRERSRQYWLDRLKTMPDAPALPLRPHDGRPRRSNLARQRMYLAPSQWQKLETQAERLGVSTATVLLTAYGLVVAAFSRSPHFYLTMMRQGAATEDRRPAARNLASTLLVELDYRERSSFRDHLYRTHARIMRDMTRSDICGLEVLSERNRVDQSTSRAASPVAFVAMLEPVDQEQFDLFQLEGRNMVFSALETPQVVLDHQAIRGEDGGVALIWDAMESAFEQGVLDAMFKAYANLLNTLVNEARSWESSTFDMRPPEQRLSHRQYNETARSLPSGLLHEYLRDLPAYLNSNIALIDGELTFSYGELRKLSNRLAWTLRDHKQVGVGHIVAVDLPKGWQQVVAVQAILSAGATYVPLGHHLPEARKRSILQQCRPTLVITDSDQPDDAWQTLPIDRLDQLSSRDDNLPTVQSAEDTAYVIFTSGSTGTPKGVVLNHQGPINTIEDINRRFGINYQDVILALSDLNFDLSVYDIFGAFAAGATLVIPPEGTGRNPAQCEALIHKHQITVWNSVPALAQLLVEHLERTQPARHIPLRLVMLSGDWLPVQLPQRLGNFASTRIISLGGATEASIWSIFYEVLTPNPDWKSIPYGFPLANQTIHVLDASLQPRPDHVPGELFIGGFGVAQGYWQLGERTAHAFISHPDTGERLYRTGDWGVRRPEGHIEFLGREDGQVKIRGYRIELGDIEAQLQKHPKVDGAIVRVTGSSAENAALAAYVLCKSDDFDADQLLNSLREQLPSYMVPSYLLRIDALPLSANGKVNRGALPDPSVAIRQKKHVPPESDTEQRLALIWQSILNKSDVSRHDNFFELGGTSFSVVRILAAVDEQFDVSLPMQTLLRHPELAEFAARIDGYQNRSPQNRSPQNRSPEESVLVPLSPAASAGAPIVWFHPSGGTVFCYQDIAKMLGDEYGAIGVQATGKLEENLSLEDLVSKYLSEVDQNIGTGPCLLAGWSFGGVLAYQAAAARIARGQRVDALIMVDAPAPIGSAVPDEDTLLRWFLGDLAQTLELPELRLDTQPSAMDRLNQGLQQLEQSGLISCAENLPIESLFQVFVSNVKALLGYSPKPLPETDTPCLLVSASTPLTGRVSNQSVPFWKARLPKQTRFIELSANHYSILQPPCLEKLVKLIRTVTPARTPIHFSQPQGETIQ